MGFKKLQDTIFYLFLKRKHWWDFDRWLLTGLHGEVTAFNNIYPDEAVTIDAKKSSSEDFIIKDVTNGSYSKDNDGAGTAKILEEVIKIVQKKKFKTADSVFSIGLKEIYERIQRISPGQLNSAFHNFGTFTSKKTLENNPYFMKKLQKQEIIFQLEVVKRQKF